MPNVDDELVEQSLVTVVLSDPPKRKAKHKHRRNKSKEDSPAAAAVPSDPSNEDKSKEAETTTTTPQPITTEMTTIDLANASETTPFVAFVENVEVIGAEKEDE